MSDAAARAHIRKALEELKLTRYGWPKSNKPTGHMRNVEVELEAALHELAPAKPKIDLGPIIAGGRPLLDQDLTHVTDGFDDHGSVWPALDDGIGHPGIVVIAPELVEITGHGRARRRDGNPNGQSLNIAVGASGLEYWIGHLENLAAVGAKVKPGGRLGTISPNHEAPHVHVGINARKVLGHDFAHHTNYTHGAPTIGVQLRSSGH